MTTAQRFRLFLLQKQVAQLGDAIQDRVRTETRAREELVLRARRAAVLEQLRIAGDGAREW